MYDYGRGTEKDGAKAVEWYEKAAAQGSQDAKDRLDERATILARLRSIRETIATRRVVEGELKMITSDAPVVLRLESAIDAVKARPALGRTFVSCKARYVS